MYAQTNKQTNKHMTVYQYYTKYTYNSISILYVQYTPAYLISFFISRENSSVSSHLC